MENSYSNMYIDRNNCSRMPSSDNLSENYHEINKEFKKDEIIKIINECFKQFELDNIGSALLKQLEAKQIQILSGSFEINLFWKYSFNSIVHKLNQVFIQCLALKSRFFQIVEKGMREPDIILNDCDIDDDFDGLDSNFYGLELKENSPEEFVMLIQNVFQTSRLNNTNIVAMFNLSRRFLFSDLKKECIDWVIDFIRHPEKQEPQQDLRFLRVASEILTELAREGQLENFKLLLNFCSKNNVGIRKLDLSKSKITREYLEALPPSPLQYLDLSEALIEDGSLSVLKKFNLKHLNLSGLEIIDEDLKNLSTHTNLRHLYLTRCSKITDEGLRNLRPLDLKYLHISHLQITDKGIEHLKTHKNLEFLFFLHCPQLTEKSFKSLGQLKKFRCVEFTHFENFDVEDFKYLRCPRTECNIEMTNETKFYCHC